MIDRLEKAAEALVADRSLFLFFFFFLTDCSGMLDLATGTGTTAIVSSFRSLTKFSACALVTTISLG